MYDVVVVGGRVAGARTAGLLAKKGADVLLVDGRKTISDPVQCTGFVSHRFLQILPDFPKKYQHNHVKKAKFYSPSKKTFTLNAKPFTVIDRGRLDDYLLEQAKKAGVEVKTGTTFIKFTKFRTHLEIETTKGRFKTRLLIGADGPNSAVAGACGIDVKPHFYGVQATVKGKFSSKRAEIYFGSKVAPKYFAWVVPLDEKTARIGLATKKDAYKYFKKFATDKLGKVPKPDVTGAIKCSFQKQIVSDRVMLIGDAASQVKPFSGGGITYSLIAAKICANAGAIALETGKFDEKTLNKLYQKKAHKTFKSSIIRGLIIHKMWQSLPDSLMDLSFLIINKTGVVKILEKLDVDFY